MHLALGTQNPVTPENGRSLDLRFCWSWLFQPILRVPLAAGGLGKGTQSKQKSENYITPTSSSEALREKIAMLLSVKKAHVVLAVVGHCEAETPRAFAAHLYAR